MLPIFADADATWDNVSLGMRLGERPRVLVTTTPGNHDLLTRIKAEPGVAIRRGRTRDNLHLPPAFLAAVEAAYGGSRLGRQELEGEELGEAAGALWTRDLLEQCRAGPRAWGCTRVVVGVDPPAGTGRDACGIVVCGLAGDGRGVVLADASCRGERPTGWARKVVSAADQWGAERAVAEVNNGGDVVREVLHSVAPMLAVKKVHASRGKIARAEPVASLFETGKCLLAGTFRQLEDELCGFTAGGYVGSGSPDRADAMVWALSELMMGGRYRCCARSRRGTGPLLRPCPMTLSIRPVETAADRRRFVNLLWDVYRYDPHWVPPLKSEELALIDPDRNPWFEHARAKLWLAEQDGRVVGRVSAQVDDLVLQHMGAGTGLMGMLEALEHAAAVALLETAEEWLSGQGMQRVLGPISLSIWDQPGLLVEGFAQAPTAMMGHHRPDYRRWVEAAGYGKAKDLLTYELDIRADLGPLVRRLVEAGARNGRIRVRPVDKRRFEAEAAIILNLLNDAWSDNWGFVPLTAAEIAYAGKKLKPIIFEDLVYIAEVDGEPAAFMITIPDINELIRDLDGRLFPVGWAKLLWRLRKPQVKRVRVPLMGVTKSLQGSRMAGQLAFMLIERCRVNSIAKYGATHGEFGWVLEDNGGMMSIAQLPGAEVNKVYRIYEKTL